VGTRTSLDVTEYNVKPLLGSNAGSPAHSVVFIQTMLTKLYYE